jgi:hypothetical protein
LPVLGQVLTITLFIVSPFRINVRRSLGSICPGSISTLKPAVKLHGTVEIALSGFWRHPKVSCGG